MLGMGVPAVAPVVGGVTQAAKTVFQLLPQPLMSALVGSMEMHEQSIGDGGMKCPGASIEKSCRVQKASTRAISAQTSTIFWRTIFWLQASRWRQQVSASARRSVVSDTARMQCTSGNTTLRQTVLSVCLSAIPQCIGGPHEVAKCLC